MTTNSSAILFSKLSNGEFVGGKSCYPSPQVMALHPVSYVGRAFSEPNRSYVETHSRAQQGHFFHKFITASWHLHAITIASSAIKLSN